MKLQDLIKQLQEHEKVNPNADVMIDVFTSEGHCTNTVHDVTSQLIDSDVVIFADLYNKSEGK